ncbi:hypothetical protein T484DRAFT_1801953 [Baffinella frigidus]|nr:hypothetical protein T484DRAFT_1801953 [Cryptophyta sp. CCMP2293]
MALEWCRAALALCLASLAVALPLHGRTGSQAGGRAGEEDTAGGAAERDAKRRTSGYRVDRQRTMGKDRTCSKEEVFGKVSKADAETLFRSIPDPASARKSLGDITRWDHVAGTPNGNLVADYVFDRLN